MNNEMTAGQLAQIYNIAKQQGCNREKTDQLIQSGILSDFFSGNWNKEMRWDLRLLGAGDRFDIGKLVHETGTLCKPVMDKATDAGLLRKDGDTLHFNMKIIPFFDKGQTTCFCAISMRTEHWESLVKDLKDKFSVEKVVFHTDNRKAEDVVLTEVEPGTREYLNACKNYPVIKGMGMSWEFAK